MMRDFEVAKLGFVRGYEILPTSDEYDFEDRCIILSRL
jgi:hypothetical protein